MPRAKQAEREHVRNSTSFAFTDEDIEILEYCQLKTGMSRVDLVRRLTRALAAGVDISGIPKIKAHANAKQWLKSVESA